MNKVQYVVDADLLQRVLNYMGSSTTKLELVNVINLVDELRNLKPFDPNTQKVPNEHLLAPKESLPAYYPDLSGNTKDN